MSPAPYYIGTRSIGGWVASQIDWRSWIISAGIWCGGEILSVDVSETSTGACTYYTAAAGDISIIGVSAMGNQPDRVYKTIPTATAVSPENLVAAIDLARVAVRLANNSGALTHGDLVSAEKDTQTIEEEAAIATLTAVDLHAFTAIADATTITGTILDKAHTEWNKILGRTNEDAGANTDDGVAVEVTLLLMKPDIVIASA